MPFTLHVNAIISFTILAVFLVHSSLYVVSNISDTFYEMYVNDAEYI
jgi:hypothetical protein